MVGVFVEAATEGAMARVRLLSPFLAQRMFQGPEEAKNVKKPFRETGRPDVLREQKMLASNQSFLPEDMEEAEAEASGAANALRLHVLHKREACKSQKCDALAATSKDATNGAPGLTTRNKKLLGAPGIATRSKDATRGTFGGMCHDAPKLFHCQSGGSAHTPRN